MLSSTVQAIQAGFRAITPRSKETNKSKNSESLLLTTPLPRSKNNRDITTPGTASTADITANTTTSSISSSITMMMPSDHDIVATSSSSSGMNANIKRTIVASSKKTTMKDEREVISKTNMTGEDLISRTATEEESSSFTITPAELWPVLDREMRLNMGNSVRCGICLSTVTNPVRTKCMHKFCRECITGYLRVGKRSVCPECNTPCTKRSLESDEEFSNLADAYKDLLRAFGLAPGTYCPEITTMTQKVDFGIKKFDDDDDDDDDSNDSDNEYNHDSDRARFDLVCVATTYQVEALPNCNEIICSKLQVEENKLVVNANFEACCDGVNGNFEFDLKNMIPESISFNAITAKSDSSSTTGSSITNCNNTDSKSQSKQEHVPSILNALPNTQENQEQAREQLEADREMQESMEEVEHHALAEKLESMAKNVETTRLLLKKDDGDDDDDKFFNLRRSSVLGSDSTNATFTSAKSHNDDDDDDNEVGSEIFATATQGTDSQETNYGDGSQDKRFDFSTGKITIRSRRDRVPNVQEREHNNGNELPSSLKKSSVSSSVSLQGLNGLRLIPPIIKKKVRMAIDNNNDNDNGKEEPFNNNNKDIFDGPSPSPSPPTPVPSPPLFARVDTGQSKRHTRKSFSKRDNRPKQKQASPISTTFEGSELVTATVNKTASSSSLSPFETGSLSPIDHEASFWVDEKPLSTTDNRLNDDRSRRPSQQQKSPSNMSRGQRPTRRCSSLGINVTGMIEDSMGGLHMMSMSNLLCSSQQEKENNDDGEDGTAATNNDDEMNEEEKNASGNDNDGDDGNDNNDKSNDEDRDVHANEDSNDNECFGGGGDIPNGDDDDDDSVDKTVAMTGEDDQEEVEEEEEDEKKDKEKKESDNINNAEYDLETHEPRRATNVTDELHKSIKNEIGKAANLPAGPQIKNNSRRRPEKKTLFAHHDDKNDDTIDVTMNDDVEDKKPKAREKLKEAPKELPPSAAATTTSGSNRETSVNNVDLTQGSNNKNKKNKVEITSDQATGMPGLWSKGTIVNVEPRTWPGMNKHGGVGRIIAINPDGSYNVAYVLGGKESNVEAIFMVKEIQEDDSEGSTSSPCGLGAAGPARRRRRTKEELDALPEDLLRQLAKEGFDTGVALKSKKSNKKQKKNRTATLSDTTNAGASKRQDRKKAPKNTSKLAGASKNTVPKRKRKNTSTEIADIVNPSLETIPSAKKRSPQTPKIDTLIEGTGKNKRPKRKPKNAPTEIAGSVNPSLETKPSAEKRSTPASKSVTTIAGTSKSKKTKRKPKNAPTEIANSVNPSLETKPIAKKRGTPKAKLEWAKTEGNDIPKSDTNKKSDFTSGGSGDESPELPLDPLLNMSREVVIMHADERYKQIMQDAITSKSVTIVTSNLSDKDKAILKMLCTKNFTGDFVIKTTETINKKTTLCIVPAEPDSGSDNVRACVRTLKVMKSALAGIPIVTPDWLRLCEKEKQIVQPEIFVRSLPTKNTVIGNSEDSVFGVAKLAASWRSQQSKTPVLPFQNTFVYLCGSYSSDKRKNLQDLLKEGGAKILTTGKSVSSKVKNMVALNEMSFFPSSGRIIVVCGDSGVPGTLSKSVERDLKTALEGEQHWPSPKTVTVIDSQWVIESVTCAKLLPATSFEPSIKKDLWQLGL